MIFSGTSVTFGRGRAVAVATGMGTQMGGIAGMLEEAPPETTPLQHELARLGRLLGLIVVVIATAFPSASTTERCAVPASANGGAGGRSARPRISSRTSWRSTKTPFRRSGTPSRPAISPHRRSSRARAHLPRIAGS